MKVQRFGQLSRNLEFLISTKKRELSGTQGNETSRNFCSFACVSPLLEPFVAISRKAGGKKIRERRAAAAAVAASNVNSFFWTILRTRCAQQYEAWLVQVVRKAREEISSLIRRASPRTVIFFVTIPDSFLFLPVSRFIECSRADYAQGRKKHRKNLHGILNFGFR